LVGMPFDGGRLFRVVCRSGYGKSRSQVTSASSHNVPCLPVSQQNLAAVGSGINVPLDTPLFGMCGDDL
jgi:hypothetical protein